MVRRQHKGQSMGWLMCFWGFALIGALLQRCQAQTSNVETVKAWTRTHVIGVPGGTLLDPSGKIAEGQRQAAVDAMIIESSNIVAGASIGLTNALQRLWDVADETNKFSGRLYLAADMDDDPDYVNLQAFVVDSQKDTKNYHFFAHYTYLLSIAPRTIWNFNTEQGTYWVRGEVATNAVLTNVLGFACYDISVPIPQQVGNRVMRTHKYLCFGTPDTPFDISDEGLEFIDDDVSSVPFTGSVTTTNNTSEIVRTFLSGFLYTVSTNEVTQ